MTALEIRKRDFATDMRRLIDKERTGNGSYNASVMAHEIANRLLSEDRELLYGWLEAHAVPTIRAAIVAIDAASRSYARKDNVTSLFAEAARQAEGGNQEPLRQGFLQAVYVINGENDRKALKDMTAQDVLFVAASYEDRAKSAMLEAAFLRAVAKKIGHGRVADKFTNIQLAELHLRLKGTD